MFMSSGLIRFKRAVSPVIAVILLIALTVAAVSTIWVVINNYSSGKAELIVTSEIAFGDSGNDPDVLVDTVSFIVKNIGTDAASISSASVTQGSNTYSWNVTAPTSSIQPNADGKVILKSPSLSKQLIQGEVSIELIYGNNQKGITTLTGTVPSGSSVDQYFYAVNSHGYQDEGTLQSSNASSLIYSLDGITAPSVPDGTVTKDYFATGTSSAYYDALALQFNVLAYNPNDYTATLRVYLFDGGYSTTWHHYMILKGQDNSSYEDVSPPAESTPWDDNADNGPNAMQLDILLASNEWTSGTFWISLRLWDAKIDQIQLIITPNA